MCNADIHNRTIVSYVVQLVKFRNSIASHQMEANTKFFSFFFTFMLIVFCCCYLNWPFKVLILTSRGFCDSKRKKRKSQQLIELNWNSSFDQLIIRTFRFNNLTDTILNLLLLFRYKYISNIIYVFHRLSFTVFFFPLSKCKKKQQQQQHTQNKRVLTS